TRVGGGRMRRACVVLALAVTLAALGCQARGGRATVPKDLAFQPVGPWQVGAANAPDPPHTGDNTLTLAVRDSLGRPLEGAAVEMRDLSTTVRASGRVTYDERRQSEVALKFSGWVRDIAAEYVGMPVEAGHPLLRVYSPELWAAQQEYLEALHVARSGSLRAE